MNTLPSELIVVPGYHGYFWHPGEGVVYSLKVDGILKPLKYVSPFRGYHGGRYVDFAGGFRLSKKGRSRTVGMGFLRRLTPTDYQVPYKNEH